MCTLHESIEALVYQDGLFTYLIDIVNYLQEHQTFLTAIFKKPLLQYVSDGNSAITRHVLLFVEISRRNDVRAVYNILPVAAYV